MTLTDALRTAFAALFANPLRASLTTLGVVIGIVFVLLMAWVLDGLDRAFTDSFAFFGDDIIYVDQFDWGGGGDSWFEQRNRLPIDLNQYRRFRQRMDGVEEIVPTASAISTDLRSGTLQLVATTIFGTTDEYIEMYAGNMSSGRFISPFEAELGSNVVVLGWGVYDDLFKGTDPIGATIRIDGRPFTVIGILPKRGTMLVDFIDDVVYIPLTRFLNLYGSQSSITINVKTGDPTRVEEVKDEVVGLMRAVRSLDPEEENDFGVNTQEIFKQFVDITRASVWGVGLFLTGLSFLVGAIGIMNIMFVSVAERTREIGIRKALGATRGKILLQFLIESIVLCLIGALIGFVITDLMVLNKENIVEGIQSMGTSFGWFESSEEVNLSFLSSSIPLGQVVTAVVISVVVGIIAGIVPAFRASRMLIVDALRSE